MTRLGLVVAAGLQLLSIATADAPSAEPERVGFDAVSGYTCIYFGNYGDRE